MVGPRQSAMQRIQVGLVGLVVVLLFVSLANMVLDRVTGETSPDKAATVETSVPDEPLAELGVTPVTSEDAPADRATGPAAPVVDGAPSAPVQPR